jgi:hypothetical protein
MLIAVPSGTASWIGMKKEDVHLVVVVAAITHINFIRLDLIYEK